MFLPFAKALSKYRRCRSRATTSVRLQGGETLEDRRLLSFDPSPVEQSYMESINRMRLDPQGELDVLFVETSPRLVAREASVQAAIDFFNVDSEMLLEQWSQLEAVAPLAWNESLIETAFAHNLQMIEADEQTHRVDGELSLGDRIEAAGFTPLRRATENVYAFAESDIHGYAGFVIDWGEGPGGIQDPAGHRINYMDPGVQEVGISVVTETDVWTSVGPTLVTQDFGRRSGYESQFVGVVFTDLNQNGIYDPGEGHGDVQITVSGSGGSYTTTTMSAGGYQLVVPAGTYQVTASGPSITGTFAVENVAKGNKNLKIDFELSSAATAPSASDDYAETNEDTAVAIDVLANDASATGQLMPTSLVVVESPRFGSADVSVTGEIVYTPDTNFNGTDDFRYTVQDSNGTTSIPATVTVTVGQISDSPTAEDVDARVAEDAAITIFLGDSVSDPDDDIKWDSLEITTQPDDGTVYFDAVDRTLQYTPRSNFYGFDTLRYRVADRTGRVSNTALVTIDVIAVNDRPVAEGDRFSIVDRQMSDLPVLENDRDVDGDLTLAGIQILGSPNQGSATLVGSKIRYLPFANATGGDSFEYVVGDREGAFSDPVTVTIYFVAASNAWQNPVNSLDVNGDGVVSPLDALEVINRFDDELTLPSDGSGIALGPPPFVDVDGNHSVSPIDALLVINQLNENDAASASSAAMSLVGRTSSISPSLREGKEIGRYQCPPGE